MAIAGIAAACGYPPGCWGPPEDPGADARFDLALMCEPLEALPGVHVAADELRAMRVESAWGEAARPLEATIELELDPGAPHLDIAAQLLGLLVRLVETRGIVLPPPTVLLAERLAAHVRCVSDACRDATSFRKTHDER